MSPRHALALTFVALLSAAPLSAQFSFGDLKKNLLPNVPDSEKAGKFVDSLEAGSKVIKGAAGIGPAEERLIGESVALEIVGRYGGLVRDEAITRRVNLVGRALAYYSTRPALPWKFAVLASPAINGFSAPGGFVFITRGLYDLAGDNDDALAAILGHEIAHITGRHALKIIERGEFLSGAASLAVQRSKDAAKVEAALGQFDGGIGKIAKTLFEKGFDPQTEYAADKAGRELAITVGYAPGALRQTLERLRQSTTPKNQIFSSHPSLAARIKQLPADPAP
jgi:predicted Zn-dependent protease